LQWDAAAGKGTRRYEAKEETERQTQKASGDGAVAAEETRTRSVRGER
jgi:hypothetical protein